MNQTCKVCGEPAAGFHFGAFTCEGCKSFFGRSYNNLSSISECKNNGECVINKKNRTACKACRLRKCLMVGMSKSGSRYGRRSNWFKIHCLLQEQQQQAQAAAHGQGTNSKSPSGGGPPPGLSFPFHPSAAGFQIGNHRPPTNDLMLLGLEEYGKMPGANNSTVSSPDSHNSDTSIDIADRSQMMKKFAEQNHHHHLSPTTAASKQTPTGPTNKDMFLPLPFSGLSSLSMMPPPSFLPQSPLLFPGYHPALYAQHQGLLKPVDQHLITSSLAMHQQQQQNNNSRFMPNHNHPMFSSNLLNNNSFSIGNLNSVKHSITAEELTKRFYLDAVLKSQMSPRNGITKSVSPQPQILPHHIQRRHLEDNVDDDDGDDLPAEARITKDREASEIDNNNNNSNQVASKTTTVSVAIPAKDDHAMLNAMTPPRSPINSSHGQKLSSPRATELRKRGSMADTSPLSSNQDNPIDLSMKTSSSTTTSENGSTSSVAGSEVDVEEERLSDDVCTESKNARPSSSPIMLNGSTVESEAEDDDERQYDQAIKRMKFQGTTPLDLTTKV